MTTPELSSEIIKLYIDDKLTIKDISNRLNLKVYIIRKILIDNNITRRDPRKLSRKLSETDEKKIIDDYTNNNISIRELARSFCCDRSCIKSILYRNNIRFKSINESNKKSNINTTLLIELFKKGESINNLCKQFNVNSNSISYHLRKDGIFRVDYPVSSTTTSIKKINILYLYFLEGKSLYFICKKANLGHVQTVKNIISEFINGKVDYDNNKKIHLYKTKLSEDKISEIHYLYENTGLSVSRISNLLSINRSTLTKILKQKFSKLREGRDLNKKYRINENYFSNINSPEKHFILGLLLTDGHNTYSKRKYITMFGLTGIEDRVLVEYVKNQLECDNPIYYNKNKDHYILTITNKTISTDLKNLGCIEDKSYLLKMPDQIKDNLFHHFLLGCIMGDGCISHFNNMFSVSLVGTHTFINSISSKIYELYRINSYIRQKSEVSSELTVSGNTNALKICNIIFDNAPAILPRKFLQYKKLVQYKKNKLVKNDNELFELKKADIICDRIDTMN